jgi:glycosyltransferase involved in cell wall biosynthesis
MRLLNLAPHCTVPPMDGADRRAWHLHESLVALGVDARFMSRKIIADHGKLATLEAGGGGLRDQKALSALWCLLSGQNYWQYKMLTPAFNREVDQLRIKDYDATIVHFLYALPVIYRWRGEQMRLLIETHNFDPDFYSGIGNSTKNPLLRILCNRAVNDAVNRLKDLPTGTTLVHVSESDAAAYRKIRSDLNHTVIENGCKLAPRTTAPDYTAPGEKQLLFVGSLSAKMNQDALVNLSKVYWPSLKGIAKIRVAGSNPPPAVAALCEANGWNLCPNISDAELEGFYSTAHYALAPFAYGAGSKLKLMEACGRGVPILATRSGMTGVTATPSGIHISDDPQDWKRVVQGGPPTAQAIQETLDFAKQVSWPYLGEKLVRVIESTSSVTIP